MMPTGMQLALMAGALLGVGLALLLWRLSPAEPDLKDALERLSPEHTKRRPAQAEVAAADSRERLGLWAMKTFPAGAWVRTPGKELALLRVSLARFYGEKVLFALVGLITPPLMTGFFALIGLRLPFVIPVLATVVFAVFMFFLPDYNARDDAKKARAEFNRALGAYIDHHTTYAVNSVGHYFGSRRFATADESRNVAWLAIPSFGESWHNNHHAFPRSYRHGMRWWEIDLTAYVIVALEKVGLAWDVIRLDERALERRACILESRGGGRHADHTPAAPLAQRSRTEGLRLEPMGIQDVE